LDSGDLIIDQSTTDSDVANLTVTSASATDFTARNIERINLEVQDLATSVTINTANYSGVTNLTISRTNPTVSGATLTGGDEIVVSNVDFDNTPTLTTGAGIADIDVTFDGASDDGATLNFDSVTETIDVADGAATINAANAIGNITVGDKTSTTNTTAVVVNAAATIGTISIGTDANEEFNGNITVVANNATTVEAETTAGVYDITAAKATTITIVDADGGGQVTAGTGTSDATTIYVSDIDSTGFTITTGTSSSTRSISLELEGTSLASDTVTVSAAGAYVTLDANNGGQVVDNLNLRGNGASVTYTLADAADVVTSITGSGSYAVNVTTNADAINAATISGVGTLKISAITTAAAQDWDSIEVTKFQIAADLDANADGTEVLTVNPSQNLEFTASQSMTSVAVDTATGNVTITAGDVNGTNTAIGTLTLGAVDTSQATANSATSGSTTGGTVTFAATDAHITATSVEAWSQSVVVSGTRNVTLSATGGSNSVKAQSVNAAGLTGRLTINVEDTTANTADTSSVTSGTGADTIEMDVGTAVVTVASGAGNDTIIITDVGGTSTFSGEGGNDTFTMTEAATAYVVVGGDGDDTFNTGSNTGMVATIVGGAGDDTLVVGAALDTSSSLFAISGVENIDFNAASASLTMKASQFANNNTVYLTGDGDDSFQVNASATTGSTINGTNVTVETTQEVTITYLAAAKADTITGGAADETISAGASAGSGGGADVYDGGAGTDTFNAVGAKNVTETGTTGASQGVVVNLGSSAVTGITVFAKLGTYISGNLTSVAAGTVAYTFTSNSTATSGVVSTIANIENVVGSAGADYIVGTSGANSITGGTGNDFISGGAGADTFVFLAPSTDGTDVISDFASGDIISVNATTTLSTYFEGAVGSVANTDELVVITGAAAADAAALYLAGTFSAASSTVIVFIDSDTSTAKVYYC
jgi:hypothetical protein